MTPEQWQVIKAKLDVALELEPVLRSAYLDGLSAVDPELRQKLQTLLASHDRMGTDFLDVSKGGQDLPPVGDDSCHCFLGRQLGAYRIIEQIGSGGMGEVFRAVRADEQYQKQVAIKLVRAGQDASFVISRFRNERQILATLDHPNIARLLDGGATQEGVPYLVMELVEGVPIDDYCATHKLPVSERLKLFLQVCSAVQYAHQRLIIHRDLKPSNIPVTREGVPKLLDFGIAKILDASAKGVTFENTLSLFRLLTPIYASPEQIKGEPITTASDVYSLGVLLYEMLTGTRPYPTPSSLPHEIAKAICEFEPVRPSSAVRRAAADVSQKTPSASPRTMGEGSPEEISKRLDGDLDDIVLMALRKEPTRRYTSVELFAADISRHLQNLPVIARGDSARYRASKFVARHKTAVAAAALVLTTLIVALAVTLRANHIARLERTRAEQRFNDLRKLANSLMFDVYDSINDLPGATSAKKEVATQALEYLDKLSQDTIGDSSLERELASAYERIGQVMGNDESANFGNVSGAESAYTKAVAIRENLFTANPQDLRLRKELVMAYLSLANIQLDYSGSGKALVTLRKALPPAQALRAGEDTADNEGWLSGVYYEMGRAYDGSGDFDSALESFRQATAIREAAVARFGPIKRLKELLSADYGGVATILAQKRRFDEAIPLMRKSLDMLIEQSRNEPNNATLRQYLSANYSSLGGMLIEKGDLVGAMQAYLQAHELVRQLHSSDTSDTLARVNFADTDLDLANVLTIQGHVSQAITRTHEALATVQGMDWRHTRYASLVLGESYFEMGKAYAALATRATSREKQLAYWKEAHPWYEKSVPILEEPGNREHRDSSGKKSREIASEGLARCEAALKRLDAYRSASLGKSSSPNQ